MYDKRIIEFKNKKKSSRVRNMECQNEIIARISADGRFNRCYAHARSTHVKLV